VAIVKGEADFLRLLISAMELSLEQLGRRSGRHVTKRRIEFYRMLAYRNHFDTENAARSFIRKHARRLGLAALVPRDTFPGSWGILYRAAERTILSRGLQLDLFIEVEFWRPCSVTST
jgi:hypothetical protein